MKKRLHSGPLVAVALLQRLSLQLQTVAEAPPRRILEQESVASPIPHSRLMTASGTEHNQTVCWTMVSQILSDLNTHQ